MWYYIEKPSSGRVQFTPSINTAARMTVGSGFFFKDDKTLKEEGKDFLPILCERFSCSEEELFDTMTTGSPSTVTQPKRRIVMSDKELVSINPDDIIHINKDYEGKPRRPGSNVAKIFECYKEGMKVSTWLDKVADLGGGLGNLRKDLAFGRITVEAKVAKAA